MFNQTSEETNWYFVDRITITLILSGPYPEPTHVPGEPTMAIELKLPYYDPSIIEYPSFMGTLWHEVWPTYCPVYSLTSFYDDLTRPQGGDGMLGFTDSIDLTDMKNPQAPPTFWHVEDVATDLILNKKITNPVCTDWHALYPQEEYCHWYHVDGWKDNLTNPYHMLLSPCDTVNLTLQPEGPTKTYHVENMNVTIKVQSLTEPGYFMYLDAVTSFEEMYYPKIYPYQYLWHEIWPYFSNLYYISNWVDNCNGVLGYCDSITLYNTESGYYGDWHVEEVAIDMVVQEIQPPTTPPMYWKPGYPDYAPSGMPDFDERQSNWTNINGWSYCGPVAVANSIWWLDSEFEKNTIPPPTYSDSFNLVTSYDTTLPKWDDHDPQNVPYLIEHLAYLMDTDSQRTKQARLDTNVFDMQTGITQYLSWTGVNPKGDCNGDGIVTIEDAWIVGNATGKKPGMAGWDMRADIDPVTTGWPNRVNADNDVDMFDMMLVAASMGNKGIFYEHTVPRPDFYYIEEEVEKCQDVVLCLGFYYEYSPGQFYREFGHFVTVAGINSTTQEIAISNPIRDDFEAGLAPGRSPVPHTHTPPPEPPYITHNNASLVSQDIFKANFYPCPGGDWELLGYPGFDPADGWHVQIEYAVITSPLGVHDVAVTNVTAKTPGKTQAYQNLNFKINVTVENQGNFTETFNVTCYANALVVGKQLVTLPSGTKTILLFLWNTTGVPIGNYTLSATADQVASESDLLDNTFTDGIIRLLKQGDCSPVFDIPGSVDIFDIVYVGICFGAEYGKPPPPGVQPYNPNADLTCDLIIDIFDIVAIGANYGA
jgi:hypothetical protein